MPESTLALTYQDLAAHVGDFAGWGRGTVYGDTAWSSTQTAVIDDCVRSGCRKVYFPTPPFDWSFLHLFASLTLSTGKQAVALPDDAAGIEGDLIVAAAAQSSWLPRVPMTNPALVKTLYAQSPTMQGRPMWAAVEQLKGTQLVAGQRQQLIVYPVADQAYTLTVQYYIVPDAVTEKAPYVYGGAVHAETFLEACLAVFEQRKDDMAGLHTQLFQERLTASMAVDRRSKGQNLGPNYDTSDDAEGGRRYPDYQTRVLYNGVATN